MNFAKYLTRYEVDAHMTDSLQTKYSRHLRLLLCGEHLWGEMYEHGENEDKMGSKWGACAGKILFSHFTAMVYQSSLEELG